MGLDNLPGVEVDEQAAKAAELAEEMENVSNGIITKQQAQAYLLMNVLGKSGPEASGFIGAKTSTVYTLRTKALQKIDGARGLVEFLDS